MLNRTSQVGIAFLIGAKKRVGKVFSAKGPEVRGFAGGVLSSVRYSIVGSGVVGFALIGIAVGIAVINCAGLLKPRKIDSEALIDLRDPLVQRFSKPSQFINDYQTLMRRLLFLIRSKHLPNTRLIVFPPMALSGKQASASGRAICWNLRCRNAGARSSAITSIWTFSFPPTRKST
jgi:hypothetical protein